MLVFNIFWAKTNIYLLSLITVFRLSSFIGFLIAVLDNVLVTFVYIHIFPKFREALCLLIRKRSSNRFLAPQKDQIPLLIGSNPLPFFCFCFSLSPKRKLFLLSPLISPTSKSDFWRKRKLKIEKKRRSRKKKIWRFFRKLRFLMEHILTRGNFSKCREVLPVSGCRGNGCKEGHLMLFLPLVVIIIDL